MKDILLVFGILLLLIVLISAFGGSVRYAEHFDQGAKKKDDDLHEVEHEEKKEKFEEAMEQQAEEETVEGFDGGAYAGVPEEETAAA